jgi:Ca2+-binding EF-hand superfamily protein
MKKMNKPLIRTHTANDLVDTFLELIDQERHIENSKIKLSEHTDFNLYDAFKIFDQLGKGSLTISEIATGLIRVLGIVPSSSEIELFFQRYDKD